jgi:Leucine-rich repeat (LRR) protein
LEKDSFISKGLIELDELAMDRCELQTVELGAFNGLTKLTILSMQENRIREITGRTFEKMICLEYLQLQYNRIEHLDVNVFSGSINVKHINLGGNELQTLHPDIFVGLPKLERVVLSSNKGLHIPTEHNFITSHSLKILEISFCNVSSVSVETFANVSALERLDLSYNNLRSIDINILRSLTKLSAMPLYSNPLQCDCQLQEVWQWCQDHNIQTTSGETDPVRNTPSEGYLIWHWVLEEIRCVQDNISNINEYKQKRNKDPVDENMRRYEKHKNFFVKIIVPLEVFVSILGIPGNFIILIIIICNKDMRTVPNMYILNVAISDIICLTCVFMWTSVEINSEFKCRFLPFCTRMSIGLSAYSIAVLSIQRYRVTVNPFHVLLSSQPTWRAAVATTCGLWTVAALFAVPTALSNFVWFGLSFSFRKLAYYKRVVAFELFVYCLIPLFVIAFSYIMMARHLLKSSCPVSEVAQNPRLNTRKNAAKIVMGLSIVFFIGPVSYHVFWTHMILNLDRNFNIFNGMSYIEWFINLTSMLIISKFLFVINSCINPVAIFCTSCLFREHLKRYLTYFCKTNSPPTNVKLTRRN